MELLEGHVLAALKLDFGTFQCADFGGTCQVFREPPGESEVRAERFANQSRASPVFCFSSRFHLFKHLVGKRDGKDFMGFHRAFLIVLVNQAVIKWLTLLRAGS
jgi:hypothetical protein